MSIFCFEQEGVVKHDYAPQCHKITKNHHHEVLRPVRSMIRRKRKLLGSRGVWKRYHVNEHLKSSQREKSFLSQRHSTQFYKPPCSPDLALCSSWVLLRLKSVLKGRIAPAVGDMKKNVTKLRMAITETKNLEPAFNSGRDAGMIVRAPEQSSLNGTNALFSYTGDSFWKNKRLDSFFRHVIHEPKYGFTESYFTGNPI